MPDPLQSAFESLFYYPGWIDEAECKDVDQIIFFVSGKNGDLSLAARLYCMDCKVRIQCLGIGMSEDYGIYGGTTKRDRDRIKRSIRRGISLKSELARIDKATQVRADRAGIKKGDVPDFLKEAIEQEANE